VRRVGPRRRDPESGKRFDTELQSESETEEEDEEREAETRRDREVSDIPPDEPGARLDVTA
jgi:hypothetical protein